MFILLLGTEIMCLVRDVVAYFHSESGREQLAIGDASRDIPDLDDVEVAFGRDSDSCDVFILCLQETIG